MQMDLDFNAPLSVSELTRRIRETIEDGFPDVWVQGEITNLRIPSSGHMYFTLKDPGAQVRAVFFRSGNRFLRFRPKDGLEVIVRGRLSVYEGRGEYQIIVEYMEPKGLGALQLAFLQLKEKLEREGLFDPARKRPLSPYPRSVGVVTSPTGAAIRDILKVLRRRAPGIRVLIAPASVQGETAPAEVARAIADLNEYGGLDAIIAGRGGGSMEDLAAFNTETVARAIAASDIPVISAVGHEVDFTIADFVADMRAPTPSVAAEVVARSEDDIRDALSSFTSRIVYAERHELRHLGSRLESAARALKDPRRLLQERAQRVDEMAFRLARAHRYGLRSEREKLNLALRSLYYMSPARLITGYREILSSNSGRMRLAANTALGLGRQRLAALASGLSALEPLAPLKRGFSITYLLPGMETLKDSARVAPGAKVRVRLMKGGIDCRVEETLSENETDNPVQGGLR